ncbi:MAG: hypothetical protein LN415_09145 [Candidatus Thermoplasmatota archaeon]|nr:hypothetical protein [Candidatus Thermoplasmatota archaeon]
MQYPEGMSEINRKIHEARALWWGKRNYARAVEAYAEVEKMWEEMPSEDPDEAYSKRVNGEVLYITLGNLMEAMGERERAMDCYRKVYDLRATHVPEDYPFSLAFNLPVFDPKPALRELKDLKNRLVKAEKRPTLPFHFPMLSLKLAEALIDEGRVEESREVLLDFLDIVDRVERVEEMRKVRGQLLGSMHQFMASHACELLGERERALSHLEKAARLVEKHESDIDARWRTNWDKGHWYEEAGAIFEKLDPRRALEYYDNAEHHYAKAMSDREYPDEYSSSFYDQEFDRQLGPASVLFRYDTFARLALRRHRVVAVIDGEAGYPLRRRPRGAGNP